MEEYKELKTTLLNELLKAFPELESQLKSADESQIEELYELSVSKLYHAFTIIPPYLLNEKTCMITIQT